MNYPYELGKAYFIRTVTMYYVGKIEWVGEHELKLSNAWWIVRTGDFDKMIKEGIIQEKCYLPESPIIGRGALVDVIPWKFDLPTESL